MRTFTVLFALFVSTLAEVCVHNNHADLEEEHVINMIITDADHNGDGIISDLDVAGYFILNFDHNQNKEVDEDEFVRQWVNSFHDNRGFAQHVFHTIDTNDDGVLNLEDIPALIKRTDTSRDDVVQVAEFKTYLEQIYKAC